MKHRRLVRRSLALVLSAMPGLGQVYVGYYQRGFVHALVVGSLITLLNKGIGPLAPLAGLFLAFVWMYNLVDAGRLSVVGTYYQLVSGRVIFSAPVTAEQAAHGDAKH